MTDTLYEHVTIEESSLIGMKKEELDEELNIRQKQVKGKKTDFLER